MGNKGRLGRGRPDQRLNKAKQSVITMYGQTTLQSWTQGDRTQVTHTIGNPQKKSRCLGQGVSVMQRGTVCRQLIWKIPCLGQGNFVGNLLHLEGLWWENVSHFYLFGKTSSINTHFKYISQCKSTMNLQHFSSSVNRKFPINLSLWV
jgi:hypothetical protein